MAVREALLTLLSIEPTYGFRLHTELIARLPHRSGLNVGQSYSTLERARKSAHIEPHGATADNLPMFRLTETGIELVRNWLRGSDGAGSATEETEDRILLTASLGKLLPVNVGNALEILESERLRWAERITPADQSDASHRAHEDLQRRQALAMLGWLDSFTPEIMAALAQPISTERPRRGRPPRDSQLAK